MAYAEKLPRNRRGDARNVSLEVLLESGARFAESMLVLSEVRRGELATSPVRRIGPPKVFDRLWHETGCAQVIRELLAGRAFEFPVERAIFLEVLHRLVAPGSDRAGVAWRRPYAIEGVQELELHHAYRAMAWLGEPLREERPADALAPRCTKDRIEEALFARDRDLFSALQPSIRRSEGARGNVGARGMAVRCRPAVGPAETELGRFMRGVPWSGSWTPSRLRSAAVPGVHPFPSLLGGAAGAVAESGRAEAGRRRGFRGSPCSVGNLPGPGPPARESRPSVPPSRGSRAGSASRSLCYTSILKVV